MLLATAFLPVPQVDTGVSLLEARTTGNLLALFQYFQQEWMTGERLPLWNVHNVNIRINNHLEGWHNWLNRKAAKGHNGLVYVEKQQRVEQYTGEYTNGSPILEQFLEALMYITPELI
ncbi:hypothetical protein T10_4455 [Trichinella papuae]|uniref:Uncharacterized protein n=1 Tax=Trichinella papuae TaxID=268474 RepID=A0A0V1MID3_9BILA|nr:hypothetical protein T10_4455 [Trichinella papuae]